MRRLVGKIDARMKNDGAFHQLVLGIIFVALAGSIWIWHAVRGSDPTVAPGVLVGGVLVSIAALIWMYRDRRDNDSDQTV